MINYDDWADELQSSKMDLIELLQQHMESVDKVEQLQDENNKLKKEIEQLRFVHMTDSKNYQETINKLLFENKQLKERVL